MKEQYVSTPTAQFQILSDGKTVWVNHENGYLAGRFSSKGIDVHAPPGSGAHCLDCRPGLLPYQSRARREEWDVFAASMKEHYGVVVPEGLVEFLSPHDDLMYCAARAEELIPVAELEDYARRNRGDQ